VARFFQRCRFDRISAGVCVGTSALSWDTAFPPLAAGVLLEAGCFESVPGDQVGECVEEQQIGFEFADFVNDLAASHAVASEKLAASPFDLGGRRGVGTGGNVLADDLPVHPAGADEIAEAVGAGFAGHGGGVSEAAQM
jgi:hypothetical protein